MLLLRFSRFLHLTHSKNWMINKNDFWYLQDHRECHLKRKRREPEHFKSYLINSSWFACKYHWLHPRISQSFILEFIPSLHGKDILHRRLLHLRSFERIWKGSFDARFLLWELLIIDLVRGYWQWIRWTTETYWRKLRCVPLRLIFQKFFARGVQVDNEASVVGWC